MNLSSLVVLLALGAGSQVRAQNEFDLTCARPSSGVLGEESDCLDATITYGTTTIAAGRVKVRSLSTDQGEWILSDEVRITTDDAELDAESTLVRLENGEIVSFELSGNPSRIAHTAGVDGFRVSAEAGAIVYDVADESLRLEGEVKFVYDESVFDTCELTYDLVTRSYSTGACGLRLTVPTPEREREPPAPQPDGP